MDYNGFGLVSKIYGDVARKQLYMSFEYDEDGNRIMKKDHRNNQITWYSYDAGGTLVAVYENNGINGSQKQIE